MVRNSLKLVPWKDDKAVTADLKLIDQASTELEAQNPLAQFALTWGEQYPQISKSWGANWPNLIAIKRCFKRCFKRCLITRRRFVA